MGVLQYKDLVLTVDGVQKGLVQNVTISCEAGLDLITHSSGVIPYISDRKGTISFEQIVSSLDDITQAPLFDDYGEIRLYDNVGSGYVSAGQCLINSIEYSLPSDGLFTCKYEYVHIGITGQTSGSSFAGYAETGRAPIRQYYAGGAPGTNHQLITIETNLNREILYNKGDPKPKHSVIVFPIETNVTLEMMVDSTGFIGNLDSNFLTNKLSEIRGCSANIQNQDITIGMEAGGGNITINDLYLSNFTTQQGGVDGAPLSFTVEYVSYDDYGLSTNGKRIVNYDSYSSGGGGAGPPSEPE